MTDPLDGFDLDNPDLPKAIKKHAMASGDYPYEDKLDSDSYEEQMYALQKQLVLLQAHLAKGGDRIMIVFEGRDAAGKGGTIKRITEHMNPRITKHVALPKPTEREQSEWSCGPSPESSTHMITRV